MSRTLALITARGGSKGLPGKNVRLLAGRPLVAHSVSAALGAVQIAAHDVVCSTDCPDIAAAAKRAGARVPFVRPAELSLDGTTSLAVALHALEWLAEHERAEYDTLLLLQPTSPLRTSAHIDEAMALFNASSADAVVGVYRAHVSPFRMFVPGDDGMMHPLLSKDARPHQRQQFPDILTENGAIYITRVEALRRTGSFHGTRCLPYVMSAASSIDIDDLTDFAAAEAQLAEVQLAEAQLAGAQLAGAQLAGAQLAVGRLPTAQLADPTFADAQLTETTLVPTELADRAA